MNDFNIMSNIHHAHGTHDGSPAFNASALDWNAFFHEAERTSLLILADNDGPGAPAAHCSRLAQALGYRILDAVSVSEAFARLSRLADLDVVLIACSGSEPGIEALLVRLDMMAASHGTRLIVITDMDGLDVAHAAVQAENSILLCRPSIEDIVTALAAAHRPERLRNRLSDIGQDGDTAQFERLSDQLVRLNRTIEALVQNRVPDEMRRWPTESGGGVFRSPARSYPPPPGEGMAEGSPIGGHNVRAMLRARRLREHIVAADLFADPAWDIMLDLMAARLEQTRVSVSSLCIAAAVPPTTALRWIRQLTERGLLQRQADPSDGRRIFIALSDEGAAVVQRWFQESRSHLIAALGID